MSAPHLHPQIRWAQRKDRVFLTIELRDIQGEKIDLKSQQLTFQGSSDKVQYDETLNLFAEVIPEESSWKQTGLHLAFILVKKNKEEPYWKRLLKEEAKFQHIAVDWSKYIDEDDEAEEGHKGISGGDWDPESMNRFGAGPGDDSDDDEGGLDDLDKPEELNVPAGEGEIKANKEEEEEKKAEQN